MPESNLKALLEGQLAAIHEQRKAATREFDIAIKGLQQTLSELNGGVGEVSDLVEDSIERTETVPTGKNKKAASARNRAMLLFIGRAGGKAHQRDIVEGSEWFANTGTAHAAENRLRKAGMVERTNDPRKGRGPVIALTDKGMALYRELAGEAKVEAAAKQLREAEAKAEKPKPKPKPKRGRRGPSKFKGGEVEHMILEYVAEHDRCRQAELLRAVGTKGVPLTTARRAYNRVVEKGTLHVVEISPTHKELTLRPPTAQDHGTVHPGDPYDNRQGGHFARQ